MVSVELSEKLIEKLKGIGAMYDILSLSDNEDENINEVIWYLIEVYNESYKAWGRLGRLLRR